MKGIALLRLGKTKEAMDILKKYRERVLQDFEDQKVITGEKNPEKEANIYSEVASIALLEGKPCATTNLNVFSQNDVTLPENTQ